MTKLSKNLDNLTQQVNAGMFNAPDGDIDDDRLRNQIVRLCKGADFEPPPLAAAAHAPQAMYAAQVTDTRVEPAGTGCSKRSRHGVLAQNGGTCKECGYHKEAPQE